MIRCKITAKRLLIIIFAAFLTAQLAQSGTAATVTEEAVKQTQSLPLQEGYQAAAENGRLTLFVSSEDGSFYLEDKQSKVQWSSVPKDLHEDPYSPPSIRGDAQSHIIIDYIFSEDELSSSKPHTANSYNECVQNGAFEINKIENGFCINFNFEILEISVPVEFTLSETYLNVNVNIDGIYQGNECILTKISLLPYFGAGSWKESGDIFVPDGSGALINFNNGIDAIYERMVYGEEKAVDDKLYGTVRENLNLPVFGIMTENKALLGIITEGDGTAAVSAAGGTPKRGYNTVFSVAVLRTAYQKTMLNGRQDLYRLSLQDENIKGFTVRYYPLTGTEADCAGLAQTYREYLTAEKNLIKRVKPPSINVDVIGAVDTESMFLGIPYRKQTALTTYKQTQAMMEVLRTSGISELSVRYSGWAKDGLSNRKILKKALASNVLGGKNELLSLNKYMSDNGFDFYPDADILRFRNKKSGYSAKTVFNEAAVQYSYLPSVYSGRQSFPPWYLLKPERIRETASGYLSSYLKYPFASVSLSSLSNMTYSNMDIRGGTRRGSFAREAEAVLWQFSQAGLKLTGENANAYAVPYMEKIFEAPIYNSAYKAFDERIPFYSMVFHGYVAMTAPPQAQADDQTAHMLIAVENGYELLWTAIASDASVLIDTCYDEFYSSSYTQWSDKALYCYETYYPLLKKVYDQPIISYKKLTEWVNEVVYENGVRVFINYASLPTTVDGVEIQANGFAVTEKVA